MSCRDALIEKVLTAWPEQTVEAILKDMRKNNVSFVPVVDGNKTLVGQFSISLLLEDTLPVSLAAGSGGGDKNLLMNVVIPASVGLSKRLQRSLGVPVSALMQRVSSVLYADSPLEAAIQEVSKAGGPVPVVERGKNTLLGMISAESILAFLEKEKS